VISLIIELVISTINSGYQQIELIISVIQVADRIVDITNSNNTPVIRTGRLAYVPTCRSLSPQIVYNTGRHR